MMMISKMMTSSQAAVAFNIVLAISAVWFFISYQIAVKVYQKRDII